MNEHNLSSNELVSRIRALEALISNESTTKDKFESVRELITGVDKRLDNKLEKISKLINKLDQIKDNKVIELTTEALPENTDKKKKRKKYLILLLAKFRNLEDEIARVKKELNVDTSVDQSATVKAAKVGKIVGFAKGPLGLVTLVAVGLVTLGSFLSSRAVEIVIKNQGCQTITPRIPERLSSLPGIKLPNSPIPNGGQTIAKVPAVKLTTEPTSGNLNIAGYGLSFNFSIPTDNADIIFNSKSVLSGKTEIDLGSRKTHELVINCSS